MEGVNLLDTGQQNNLYTNRTTHYKLHQWHEKTKTSDLLSGRGSSVGSSMQMSKSFEEMSKFGVKFTSFVCFPMKRDF